MTVNPLADRAFGSQAAAYERGRPGWPADAVARLLDRWGARQVVDLAAGTGKLTRILVEHAHVIAIEPVDGMRAVLERQVPAAQVVIGTAEAIPLPDESADAVFVAEALHWFDLDRAPAEIARVLRPGGHLAVLWHRPGAKVEWLDEVYDSLKAHRIEHDQLPDKVEWRAALEATFGPLEEEVADHDYLIDRERLLANFASHSSIGGLPRDRFEAALAAARAVLERHDIQRATVPLRTHIFIAQKRAGDSAGSAG